MNILYIFGHLGAAQQAVKTTLMYDYLIKIGYQTVTYLYIQQTRSNFSIHLESCLVNW